MEELPDPISERFQNYEVTVEPGHLTLIVSTTGGDLHTFSFETDSNGELTLTSQTKNGTQVDDDVPKLIKLLLSEHPVLNASNIS